MAALALIFVAGPITTTARAQDVRPIPPPGIAVPDADKAELTAGLAAFAQEIDALKQKPAALDLLPDVQIYYKAVHDALTYGEFFNPREIATAKALLTTGRERAAQLRDGKPAWTTATGLVVRGYASKIDGSVQPYGLVVPTEWTPGSRATKHRLDFFFHGRGETLSELAFIDQRQRQAGEFTPPGAFVLHPYGRFCNANRFAGEIDLFEALADVEKHYPIDTDRIVVRGFSMGGASAWQFATHFAGDWLASAPGAGFSETAEFLNAFAPGKTPPTWYEQALWHWYDSIDYAVNLSNTPAVVAYSGENDRQKQAADRMADAMAKEGMTLVHVIGPKTEHRYEANAKIEINRRIDDVAVKGRDPLPAKIRFTTWTLRYNTMRWLTVDGLEKHWTRARVDAERTAPDAATLTTSNVSALSLDLPGLKSVTIDGQKLAGAAHFVKDDRGRWKTGGLDARTLRKRSKLQGPIDDAFMSRFIFVRPTGKTDNAALAAWAEAERTRAVREWRKQFRGDVIEKDDTAITAADIAESNLVLWGDAKSNAVLARIAAKLPKLPGVGGTNVPVFVYPNPLNPTRYVVVNSGVTYREAHYLNNAMQTPKLPDWAVVDITVPPSPTAPGRVADAGFFDETWKLNPKESRR